MKRILIIDDEEAMRDMLYQIIEGEGYEIVTACDGDKGIKLHRKTPFDLIITDIVMPGKEGLETIMELKRHFPNLKIIAISGGGRIKPDNYLAMAKELGADKIFMKPFDIDDFLETVREIME